MDFKNIFTATERKACYFLVLTGFIGILYGTFSEDSYSQSLEKTAKSQISSEEISNVQLDSTLKVSLKDSIKKQSSIEPISEPNNLKKKFDTENNSSKLDLNSATLEDFIRIHGIGPKTAQKIIDLRNKKGRFDNVDELIEVKGIGKKKLAKIKDFVVVNPKN